MIGFVCFFPFSFCAGANCCLFAASARRARIFGSRVGAPIRPVCGGGFVFVGVGGHWAWKKVTQLNSPLHQKQIRGCSIESSCPALGPM
jgi:hypothetical protein